MKTKVDLSVWVIIVSLLFEVGDVIAVPLTPKPGDGTAVLDLNSAPGDQNVRILYDVKPSQAVNVQVLLNQELAVARTFGVVLKFDPKKLAVILGRGDGVFANAISPGPPDVQGNIVKYGEAFLQGSVTAKGPVAVIFFRTLSNFSGDTEIVLTELKIGVIGQFREHVDVSHCPALSLKLAFHEGWNVNSGGEEPSDFENSYHLVGPAYCDIAFADKRTCEALRKARASKLPFQNSKFSCWLDSLQVSALEMFQS